jgi:hypothetical protein
VAILFLAFAVAPGGVHDCISFLYGRAQTGQRLIVNAVDLNWFPWPNDNS